MAEWNRERGYGFLSNDRGDVRLFLHIREFVGGVTPPQPGDRITFYLDTDERGRPQAVRATNLRKVRCLSPKHFLILLLLLALPAYALLTMTFPIGSGWIAGFCLIASITSYSFYSQDKECAESGQWRISELRLHVLELIGGWPGAFLAQRRFRHKCAKSAYQFTYWLIVVGHQIFAIDILREGEVSHTAWSLLRSLIEIVTGPEVF